VGNSKVGLTDTLKLAEAAQLRWPLPEDLDDQKLDQLLLGQRTAPPSRRLRPAPDFAAIHHELGGHYDQRNPGEKLFVDYAGATIPIHDRESGAVHPAAISVRVLPTMWSWTRNSLLHRFSTLPMP